MWREVTIRVPDLDQIKDTELGLYFRSCDGKWSESIRSAMERFAATGLDLNQSWADTHQDWRCPSCHRVKADLLRVSDTGILLAKLEVHHDHLGDFIKQELKHRYGPGWGKDNGPPAAARAEEIAERLIVRFPWQPLCIDCNGADAAVKRSNKNIPVHFSFTPKEIGEFISVRPNVSHEIDHAAAAKIWATCAPTHGRLRALAEHILSSIVVGDVAGCAGLAPARVGFFDVSTSRLVLDLADPGDLRFLGEVQSEILTRSLSNDGVNSKKKRAVGKSITPPTDEEYRSYQGGGNVRTWAAVDDAWRCPICKRRKREILRPGKGSQKWVGRLHEFRDFVFDRVRIR